MQTEMENPSAGGAGVPVEDHAAALIVPDNTSTSPVSQPAPRLSNTRTVDEWAAQIGAVREKSVAGVFELGIMLETAREELGAKEFGALVKEKLRYSKGTVSKLVAIATCDILLDVSHVKLPASWGTLYALTKLTAEQFAAGLASGVIHGGMERSDVAKLRPAKEKPAAAGTPVERGADDVRKFVAARASKLSESERDDFLRLVRRHLLELAASPEPEKEKAVAAPLTSEADVLATLNQRVSGIRVPRARQMRASQRRRPDVGGGAK